MTPVQKTSLSNQAKIGYFLLLLIVIANLVILLVLVGVVPKRTKEIKGLVQGLEDQSKQRGIKEELFAYLNDGQAVYRYTLTNRNGVEIRVLTFGGIITHMFVPDKTGKLEDICLGFDELKGYEADAVYFGALVGRFAGRIANGQFTLDGQKYYLTTNNQGNTLHGGVLGWNKAVWKAKSDGDILYLQHISQNGDQGFPGEVHTQVAFHLTEDNELQLNMSAVVYGSATPISLTTHPYFNLAGKGTIDDHQVQIFADYYLPGNLDVVPTGDIQSVNNTSFDFTRPRFLREVLQNVTIDNIKMGFDHTYCLRGAPGRRVAARIYEPTSGRIMEIFTNQPGMQFYTGNYLSIAKGKNGQKYGQHDAFCMEPEGYPDAINKPNFPDCVLYPGATYVHDMAFKFSTTQ